MSIAWLWVLVLLIFAGGLGWNPAYGPRTGGISTFFAVLAALIAASLMGHGIK